MGLGEDALIRGAGSPRVFRILLEYDGSGFFGWQVQPAVRTVQGEVERALARVLGHEVKISGAGRTDRGVHALGQVASFESSTNRPVGEIGRGLAALLPPDVLVREVVEAEAGFHARHSAVGRRYRYLMRLEPTALDRARSWVLPFRVRVTRMRMAARLLVGEHDFAAFGVALAGCEYTRLRVTEVKLVRRGPVVAFEICGNRFLRKMVRSVVGGLVEVGRGRFDPDIIGRALAPDREVVRFPVAPARGLYLVSVAYGDSTNG